MRSVLSLTAFALGTASYAAGASSLRVVNLELVPCNSAIKCPELGYAYNLDMNMLPPMCLQPVLQGWGPSNMCTVQYCCMTGDQKDLVPCNDTPKTNVTCSDRGFNFDPIVPHSILLCNATANPDNPYTRRPCNKDFCCAKPPPYMGLRRCNKAVDCKKYKMDKSSWPIKPIRCKPQGWSDMPCTEDYCCALQRPHPTPVFGLLP
eukprot:comp11703_c0_seq1/m.6266 comp11703_c0_seq1/g.6266  ORF comp11703_c0_seq1/g.6266 comp11703_c0_seq1/m.6266 type:complete len:205 (-) comp11703_c0_seq1:180-794(-)